MPGKWTKVAGERGIFGTKIGGGGGEQKKAGMSYTE